MRSQHFEAKLTHEGDEIVGQIRHYGDPLFILECLAVIVAEIAKTSGVPPLEVAADLHGLIARRQRTEAAIRARKDQARSKVRPEFDCLYADTPGLFDLVTIEEFAARMGVSVDAVRDDGAIQPAEAGD